MLALIQAIQAAIQASGTISYVRDGDVFITEDIRLVRGSGEYPAIGIKDGGTGFASLASHQDEETLEVTVVVYARWLKQGTVITGSGTGKPGVLQMAKDVVDLLRDNTLGGIVETALPVRAEASEVLPEGNNRAIQMLPVTIRYTREV